MAGNKWPGAISSIMRKSKYIENNEISSGNVSFNISSIMKWGEK
jgi:hypothetical protein